MSWASWGRTPPRCPPQSSPRSTAPPSSSGPSSAPRKAPLPQPVWFFSLCQCGAERERKKKKKKKQIFFVINLVSGTFALLPGQPPQVLRRKGLPPPSGTSAPNVAEYLQTFFCLFVCFKQRKRVVWRRRKRKDKHTWAGPRPIHPLLHVLPGLLVQGHTYLFFLFFFWVIKEEEWRGLESEKEKKKKRGVNRNFVVFLYIYI